MTKLTNWNKTLWEEAIGDLPKGLTATQAAHRLKKPYALTWRWLNHFGYDSPDTRGKHVRSKGWIKKHRRLDPAKANWKRRDVDLAKQFGVSRERVRQVRNREGKRVEEK